MKFNKSQQAVIEEAIRCFANRATHDLQEKNWVYRLPACNMAVPSIYRLSSTKKRQAAAVDALADLGLLVEIDDDSFVPTKKFRHMFADEIKAATETMRAWKEKAYCARRA